MTLEARAATSRARVSSHRGRRADSSGPLVNTEQSDQTGMGEAALGLGRARREEAHSSRMRRLGAREPECRLPDARFALEYTRSRPSRRVGDENVREASSSSLPTISNANVLRDRGRPSEGTQPRPTTLA